MSSPHESELYCSNLGLYSFSVTGKLIYIQILSLAFIRSEGRLFGIQWVKIVNL